MPPHCDTMDGPIVKMAQKALDEKNIDLILPYAYKDGEKEIKDAFQKVIAIRNTNDSVRKIADLYFFETVVRVHRAGEGAPYTGLKPAGLSEGPIIPIAEKAIETESAVELINTLCHYVEEYVGSRFKKMLELKKDKDANVDKAREYVEAMLGLQVYSHKVYLSLIADPHAKVEHKAEAHKH